MIELRPEQRTTVDKAKIILAEKNIVYLACEVRVGKTFMGITVGYESGWKNILFVTKKNAIEGIQSDFFKMALNIRIKITNFEQVHKLINEFDGIIIDEAHSLGAFAKPSKRTKILRELIGTKPVILMSGTPTPESPSQIYHQFWISQFGPFQQYTNFYKWAKDFVIVKKKFISGFQINDYSEAKEELVNQATAPFMVNLSQVEAGFTSFVDEEILTVQIDTRLYELMKRLKKDKIYKMKDGHAIIADTPVKLQSLFHQISSGTLKISIEREGQKPEEFRYTLDESKAWFIKTRFAGQKIALFYKFIAEGELLRRIFPNHTDNPTEFNKFPDKYFICQVVSGREGTNLSTADALVMYNIDFSATSYWQARARMQTKDRKKASKLYWIFSEKGLEHFIYKAVVKKQNYTKKFFVKDMKLIGI
jgi:hypothetical protein